MSEARRFMLGVSLIALVGCGEPGDLAVQGAGDAPVGFAVVCSDYVSSQVSLLQPDGVTVAAESLIHSGSEVSRLALSLSGDVVLPSSAPLGDRVLLVDRTHSVITWVETSSALVVRQLSTADGFASNPHDALETAGGDLLVTRYNRAPGETERGDDVAVFGSDDALKRRLTFPADEGYAARPDRLIPFQGGALVSLNHGASDYSAWGVGRYARLRLTNSGWEVAATVDLEDAANCGGLATDGERAALVCTGAFDAGQPNGDGAGVALIGPAGEADAWLSGADARVDGALAPAVTFAGGDVYLVRFGVTGQSGDAVLRWEPGSDVVEEVLSAEDAFAIDALAPVGADGLLAPIGSLVSPRMCRFAEDDWRCQPVCNSTGLPPRSVLALDNPG